ncbi:MAG: ATP-binding protein [Phycisphaerales bacterium]
MIGQRSTVRMRLAMWFGATVGVVLVAFAVGIYAFTRANALGMVRDCAHRDLESAAGFVRASPGSIAKIGEITPEAPMLVLRDGSVELRSAAWARLGLPGIDEMDAQLAHDGGMAWPSAATTSGERRGEAGRHVVDWSCTAASGESYRVAATVMPVDGRVFTVAVAASEQPVREALGSLARSLLIGLPVALGLAALCGHLVARRMLAPIQRMADAARQIGGDRLDERLPVENPRDEFGRLGTLANESLDRLQGAFDRQRRFTADASHEMRTPLTAIRSAGEVALRREQQPEEYRETIGAMLEGVTRLTDLIDRLLLLARADAGKALVRRESVDAKAVVEEVAELLQPVADERRVALSVRADASMIAHADRVLLRQALVNLVDNAVKYTPAGGSVSVVARRCNGDVAISVNDTGPGIGPEDRERIFDRFFRIDPARARSEEAPWAGGAGLGLAIARWAASANDGRIELESELGRGSTFTLTVPAADVVAEADRGAPVESPASAAPSPTQQSITFGGAAPNPTA